MTTQPIRLAVVAAVAIAVACPALAGAQQGGWKIRAHLGWSDPDGSFSMVEDDGTRIHTSVDSSVAFLMSGEYRFGPRLAMELGLMAGHDSDFELRISAPEGRVTVVDNLGYSAFTLGLNIYFTTGEGPQFYAGPLVARVGYANLTFRVPGESLRVNVDDDFGFGGTLGLDVPIGRKGWFFTATAKYIASDLDASPTGEPAESISFDPLILGLGFGFRF